MKSFFLISLLISLQAKSQEFELPAGRGSYSVIPVPNNNLYRLDSCHTLACRLNSIKQRVLLDTSKFTEGDPDPKDYSPLFIVNRKYQYKLDIIPPKHVLEFVNEYLVPEKVDSIFVLNDAAVESSGANLQKTE